MCLFVCICMTIIVCLCVSSVCLLRSLFAYDFRYLMHMCVFVCVSVFCCVYELELLCVTSHQNNLCVLPCMSRNIRRGKGEQV